MLSDIPPVTPGHPFNWPLPDSPFYNLSTPDPDSIQVPTDCPFRSLFIAPILSPGADLLRSQSSLPNRASSAGHPPADAWHVRLPSMSPLSPSALFPVPSFGWCDSASNDICLASGSVVFAEKSLAANWYFSPGKRLSGHAQNDFVEHVPTRKAPLPARVSSETSSNFTFADVRILPWPAVSVEQSYFAD